MTTLDDIIKSHLAEFDERFQWFFDNQTDPSLTGTTTPDDLKDFLAQAMRAAVEAYRDSVVFEEIAPGVPFARALESRDASFLNERQDSSGEHDGYCRYQISIGFDDHQLGCPCSCHKAVSLTSTDQA